MFSAAANASRREASTTFHVFITTVQLNSIPFSAQAASADDRKKRVKSFTLRGFEAHWDID